MWRKIISILMSLIVIAYAQQEQLNVFSKVLDDCARGDVLTCLQVKALGALDRAARSDHMPLFDSMSLDRLENSGQRDGRALTENEITVAKNTGTLGNLLWDRLANFISGRSVRFNLPKVTGSELQQGMDEGRGKMKKMMSMMMMAGAMKAAMLIPLKLGALLLIAGKALLISKVALVISLIIVLKKLLSQKQDEHHIATPVHGGWSNGGGGGGWDRRSIAQSLAYKAYRRS